MQDISCSLPHCPHRSLPMQENCKRKADLNSSTICSEKRVKDPLQCISSPVPHILDYAELSSLMFWVTSSVFRAGWLSLQFWSNRAYRPLSPPVPLLKKFHMLNSQLKAGTQCGRHASNEACMHTYLAFPIPSCGLVA